MFDIFKKEIKIGDVVKLYLTTGKEPEGTVVEIGDTYVLIHDSAEVKSRYFDKIIGGWDIIKQISNNVIVEEKKVEKNQTSNNNSNDFDIQKTIKLVDELLNSTNTNILQYIIEPNVNIYKVFGSTCNASNNEFPKILILNNRIIDSELIEDIKNFQFGEILPVSCLYYQKKEKEAIVTAVIKPQTIKSIFDKLIDSILNNQIAQAHGFISFLKLNGLNGKKLNEIKKCLPPNIFETKPTKLEVRKELYSEELSSFKNIEKELNKFINENQNEKALVSINQLLSSNLPSKYKSSLLLKKAQIYSSQNNPIESEKAYVEVIEFNLKYNSSPNNLSHLYSELARLQSINSKKQEAIKSAQTALKLNSKNSFAEKILNQLQATSHIIKSNDVKIAEQYQQNENLLIEDNDETFLISKLIDIDLEEHKFTDSEIISNNGKPTPIIAKRLLETAKEKKEGELSDRYPLYLEAAKAFKELNIGSYDTRDYLEAVAFYSMLKGNSLFIKFKNAILNNELDVQKLSRIKDSSCSYFVEALNLLSNIKSELLLSILTNYLKLNIVFYFLKTNNINELTKLFKGQFSETFGFCVQNSNKEIEKIAYSTIVVIGAASINAWNKLAMLPKGTGRLYDEFKYENRKQRIYSLLLEVESVKIDNTLAPSMFLKKIFIERRKLSDKLFTNFTKLSFFEFSHNNFNTIKTEFESLNIFDKLLNDTDIEIKNEVNRVINIVLPYINRNQTERTNILIQARTIIEKTLTFISGNTTYYGRTLYYSLLKKWKSQIDNLLEERIAKSYPVFEVIIDPPYFHQRENDFFIPIILKNVGESTSTGYQAEYYINSNQIKLEKEFENIIKQEIPAGSQISIDLLINGNLSNFNSIDFKILISPVYQDKVLESNIFSFTIEKEPTSNLIYEDIPWKDGPIPSEQMFKGRKKLVMDLAQHYLSIDRDKPYILYGLTRTGKSSILKYLQKELENEPVKIKGKEFTIKTFSWDFSEAASQDKAGDFYYYTLYENTYEPIIEMLNSYKSINGHLQIKEGVRFKDFKTIIEFLHENQIYPIFFIDEFSFIKNLMDKGTINSAYLHSLRQFSLNELASFIFSGTYDIKHLVKNEKYGITGQLVNTIEHQVNEIEPKHSEELINVIKDKLIFTNEAIEQIKFLSGNVPYFIQIICKNCGYYAVENRRKIIGFPELENVINIITGKKQESGNSLIKKLPEGSFQNNQFSPQDPREVACLISTIEFLNRNNIKQRGISYAELEKFWAEKKLTGFRPRLAEAITILKEKKIIFQYEDETMPVYKLSVDLFRRWWSNHHPDIDLVFNTLRDE